MRVASFSLCCRHDFLPLLTVRRSVWFRKNGLSGIPPSLLELETNGRESDMKNGIRKKGWLLVPVILLLAAAPVLLVAKADVLVDTGLSVHDDGNGLVEYAIHLENAGRFDVTVLDVRVNGRERPDRLRLGAGHAGRVVQPGTDDPAIRWTAPGAMPIRPRSSMEEAARNGERTVPVQYGLAFAWPGEIERVTIAYRYLGLEKTLDVTRWFSGSGPAL
jgi:hypothetical protein